jgi:hypothetical protein
MTAGVIAALVAILAVVGLLTGSTDSNEESADGGVPSIASIARGVERVRELRFEHLPRVRRVSGEQARADGLRELDRETPPRALAGEERLLKMLGLLPARASLRDLAGKTLASEVGGYYVPRTGTLSIVGEAAQGGILGEITLAHELTHALEDQHFGIGSHGAAGFRRDRGTAETALHEGTATIAMVDYAVLKQTGRADIPASVRAQAVKALGKAAVPASSGLPRYLREGLVFPYAAGARLVNRIEGRGGWAAVNRAFRRNEPASTEQVMHPAKYDADEAPVRVRVAAPPGTHLVEQGDFGEFDTEQLLRAANGRARSARAAAGWGGGGFALWRVGGRYGLELRWVWDSARDAREFAAALRFTARRLGGATVKSGNKGVELQLVASAAEAMPPQRGLHPLYRFR